MNSSENQGRKWSAVFSSPRFRKRLRRALITLLVLGSLTGATGIFIQYFYEDTVKSIIIAMCMSALTVIEKVQSAYMVFRLIASVESVRNIKK